MSFFNRSNKNREINKHTPLSNDEKELQDQIDHAVRIYFNEKEAKLNLKDKKGNAIGLFEAYPGLLNKLLDIKSSWDRRSIVFSVLDDLFVKRMPPSVYANRLIEDRYADKALDVLQKIDNQKMDGFTYCTFARANMILGDHNSSIEFSKKAFSIFPDDSFVKYIYADSLHLRGEFEKAHEIYTQLMNNSGVDNNINSSDEALKKLLGFEGYAIRSPILAVTLLKSGCFSESAWNWAEDEFYFSPFFRCQHAYWLLETKNDLAKSFAKLLALAKEMPWVREAVINTLELFDHLDPAGNKNIMPEDRVMLKELVAKNNWSKNDLNILSINL